MRPMILLLALVLLLPSGVHASGAEACPSLASEASAERPHGVDPSGDHAAYAQLPEAGGGQYDARAFWVGLDETGAVTANLRVEGLPEEGQRDGWYVITYGTDAYVSAQLDRHGGASFEHGTVERREPGVEPGYPRSYRRAGETAGSVDRSTGDLSIVLPADTLPERGAEAVTLEVELVAVYWQASTGAGEPYLPPLGTQLTSHLADEVDGLCEVRLDPAG